MASTIMGNAPLHMHLGGDPGLLSRVAIEEIRRVPVNGMRTRDMHGILRMAAILAQLAADLHEAHSATTGNLELPWWRLDTVQKLLGIEPSNSDGVIQRTVFELESLAKYLAGFPATCKEQTAFFELCVTALMPWRNIDITEFLKLEGVPQPA